MIAIGRLLLAIAIGCAAMRRPLLCLVGAKPRWAVMVLMLGAGAVFGIGATSILFFIADLLMPRFWWAELVVEIGALVWLVAQFRAQFRRQFRDGTGVLSRGATQLRQPFNVLAASALVIVLILATGAMSKAWDQNPQGQWDAWSIWNLRAKFLASSDPDDPGNKAARAWSPLLVNTHPEYPLLSSGAIARIWTSNAPSEVAPIAIGYTFFLALIGVVTGGLAIARGALTGLIAGLTLATSGALLHEVPSQYADVPLAAYLACALIFLLIDRPIWAGVFAGFAAWTKDEGALFCAVMIVLLAIFRPKYLLRTAMGMLPGGVVFGAFKLFFAPHVTAQFGAGSLSRFANAGRWGVVLSGIGSQILSLGAGWFHPVFILAAFAIGVRFRNDSRSDSSRDLSRDAYFCTALAMAMLAGYCVAMVTSPDDAAWQTGTAAGRLVVQWWPLAVIAAIVWLRPAEELEVEESPARKKRR
jgi:hypothetical protein